MGNLTATFIDYENVYYYFVNQRKDLMPAEESLNVIEKTRHHFEQQGLRVILGRAYGDFERLPNAMGQLQLMGFDPRFTLASPHKSSSDIVLSLDALEVLLTRDEIEHFVIMAGDRDYLPILRRLRERAKDIWVAGFLRNTSGDLRNVVGPGRFLELDGFIAPANPEAELARARSVEVNQSEEERTCLRLLFEAQATYKNPEIWLSPFLQSYMNQSFAYLDRQGRRKLIERLEQRGLVRIERRQGNPYDYSVIVLSEDAARLALGLMTTASLNDPDVATEQESA